MTEAKNYLIMALTAYKAAAEVIFDRLFNVTLVCQIIKPLMFEIKCFGKRRKKCQQHERKDNRTKNLQHHQMVYTQRDSR